MAKQDKDQRQDVPQRGALQVTITPSTQTLSADNNFSIAVNITNPFDVPITTGSVSTILPVDLYDTALATRRAEQERAQRQIEATRNDLLRRMGSRAAPRTRVREGALRPALRMLFRLMPGSRFLPVDDLVDMTSMAVAQAAEVDWGRPSWNRLAEATAQLVEQPQIVTEEALTEDQIQAKVDEILRPMREEYQRLYDREIEQPIVLQPGDSTTKVFTLRTRRGLTFKPASYNLNILLAYEADGVAHTQTIPYALDIQASLTSVVIGALMGSLFGVFASDPNVLKWEWRRGIAKSAFDPSSKRLRSHRFCPQGRRTTSDRCSGFLGGIAHRLSGRIHGAPGTGRCLWRRRCCNRVNRQSKPAFKSPSLNLPHRQRNG